MAKLVVEVDTETKVITATLNGDKVQDINSISISKFYDDYYGEQKMIYISTSEKSDDDVQKYTSIMAAEKLIQVEAKSEKKRPKWMKKEKDETADAVHDYLIEKGQI